MAEYQPKEQDYLNDIYRRIDELKTFLHTHQVPHNDLDALFVYVQTLRTTFGNSANLQSFLSTLLAKQYLMKRFAIDDFDSAEKAQGAPGLDLDLMTSDGQRIIGEIKSTIPYGETDLGAQQKDSFRKDFAKLNEYDADHKFFFVTHPRTYQVVLARYKEEIPDVEVILLVEQS